MMAAPDDDVAVDDEMIDAMIARRAYEISQSVDGQTDLENWVRAERELIGSAEQDTAARSAGRRPS
jgi:hypothetical protein